MSFPSQKLIVPVCGRAEFSPYLEDTNIRHTPVTSSPPLSCGGTLEKALLSTLAYFDIWQYPLTAEELYAFLPTPAGPFREFRAECDQAVQRGILRNRGPFYFLRTEDESVVSRRNEREIHARMLWRFARISTHVIKRFPFVRSIMISGDLSKNSTDGTSDIDFFIIAASNRLWIARTLLVLFKKVFLLNSKKFFCLNSFVAEDHLCLDDRNIYQATEVATLKPLYRAALHRAYLDANRWIYDFFPNFNPAFPPAVACDERRSLLQVILESLIDVLPADRIDRYLQVRMELVWARRYPEFDTETRMKIFRTTRSESRAYGGNFEQKILSLYRRKLEEQGIPT